MKKKIVFTLPTLQGGGAEKVISSVALNINKKKYDVQIVVFDLARQKYLKDKEINIINLNCSKITYGLFKFIKVINEIKPDILISSVSHLNLFVSLVKPFLHKKIKLIVRESNFLSENIKFQSNYILMKYLYKLFYNNVDKSIVFSKKHKHDTTKITNINHNKISIINNPVDLYLTNKLSKQKIKKKYNKFFKKKVIKFVYAGSLSFQKGLDIFINSLALISEKKFVFNIIGAGSEKENLIKLVKDKKLSKKINFIDYQKNPFPYINKSDVFIMCSRYEGMSNTVLETLSLNKPIIFFNNTGASTDLLKKSKSAYLINSNDPLFISKKIKYYKLPDKKLSNVSILKKFRLSHVVKKYEKILDDIL